MKRNKGKLSIVLVLSLIIVLMFSFAYAGCDNDDGNNNGSTDNNPQTSNETYTITWKNYDGTVLETDRDVAKGVTPTYDGATPTRPEDANNTYAFSGWTPAVVAVTQNATYTATFTSTPTTYTVTWKNYDGTTLETDRNVARGATPSYDGVTPTRPDDANYTYTFSGWTPTPVAVTQNATYTATFRSSPKVNKYYITWRNWDNSILALDQVNEGEVPAYTDGEPTKPEDENYTYEFIGWEPTPVRATQNATYTAQFASHQKISPTQGEYFVGKKFTVQSIECSNAQLKTELEAEYANAYAAIFESGLFELVMPHNAILDVMLGTYALSPDGKVATLTIRKMYDGDERAYYLTGENAFDLVITYSEGAYALPMVEVVQGVQIPYVINLSLSNESPMYANIPSDPNGSGYDFNPQYQVNKRRWDELFNNYGDFGNERFTVTSSGQDVLGNNYSYTYEVDEGKYHYILSGYPAAESYREIKSQVYNEQNQVIGLNTDYYYLGQNSEWNRTDAQIIYDFYIFEFGTLPIDFSKVTYSSELHYYSCSSVRFTDAYDDTHDITNFRVYFENGNLKKITFTQMFYNYEYNFTNQGTTSVTLPVLPSTDPLDYYSTIENKVYVFKEATGFGSEGERALMNQLYANAIVSLFNDNNKSMEFTTYKEYDGENILNVTTTVYGTYNLTQYGGDYVRGNVSFVGVLVNGVYTENLDDSYPYRYYFSSGEVRVQIDSDCYLWFSTTNNTPVHTEHPPVSNNNP